MHEETKDAENEISHVIHQLRIQNNLLDWLIESAHVSHDADEMDALEDYLKRLAL